MQRELWQKRGEHPCPTTVSPSATTAPAGRAGRSRETPTTPSRESWRRCSPACWTSPSRSPPPAAPTPGPTPSELSTQEILDGLRRYLPADIGAVSLEQVEPRFHARFSCTGKTYTYRIWNSDEPNVFERNYLYHLHETLDVPAMRRAAEDLCGTHDYKAFCSLKRTKKSTVRRVDSITIQELGPELLFTFEGNGFLYHMVRILVGTLLEVGRGNLRPEEMGDILVSQDRKRAGETVPACGLCLVDVRYEKS